MMPKPMRLPQLYSTEGSGSETTDEFSMACAIRREREFISQARFRECLRNTRSESIHVRTARGWHFYSEGVSLAQRVDS